MERSPTATSCGSRIKNRQQETIKDIDWLGLADSDCARNRTNLTLAFSLTHPSVHWETVKPQPLNRLFHRFNRLPVLIPCTGRFVGVARKLVAHILRHASHLQAR